MSSILRKKCEKEFNSFLSKYYLTQKEKEELKKEHHKNLKMLQDQSTTLKKYKISLLSNEKLREEVRQLKRANNILKQSQILINRHISFKDERLFESL